MNVNLSRQFRLIALVLAILPMLGSCAATRWGGGNGIVIDAETKQPMAGVYVVLYLSASKTSAFPFGRGSYSCGPDFYTVSDADGKFTIPEDALDYPWQFSLTPWHYHFNAVAYKPGYVERLSLEGVAQTGDGNVKTGPLKVTFEMTKDVRTLYQRMEWLGERTSAGCLCNDMHRTMAQEFKDIAPTALREMRARGFVATGIMPRRSCE